MLPSHVLGPVALVATAIASSTPDVSNALQSILNKAHQGIYDYPTSLTQGIVPVRRTARCIHALRLTHQSIEGNPQPQRLLARCALLQRPFGGSGIRRVRRLALQWYPLCRARAKCLDHQPHLRVPLHRPDPGYPPSTEPHKLSIPQLPDTQRGL